MQSVTDICWVVLEEEDDAGKCGILPMHLFYVETASLPITDYHAGSYHFVAR